MHKLIRMGFKVGALLLGVLLTAQASAQSETCDPAIIQSANTSADKVRALIRDGKQAEAIARYETVKSKRASCPKDPNVMFAEAMSTYHLLKSPGQSSLEALERISAIDALLNAINDTGGRVHAGKANMFLAKEVSRLIILLADKNGAVHPILEPGGVFASCPPLATNRAQSVWYAYRKNWTGAAAPIYLEKLANACEGETGTFRREPQKYYGDYLRAKAKRTEDPYETFALMVKAEKAMSIHGEGEILTTYERPGARLFWTEYVAAEAAVTPDFNVLTRPDLFAGENDWQLAYSEALVGYHIDQIWRARYAATSQEQINVQIKRLYTDAKILQAKADLAGDKAQRALYRAVIDYEEGRYRSDSTEGRGTMSKSFWKFLKPY